MMTPKQQENIVDERFRKYKDILSLICARDAYILRQKTAKILWNHLEQVSPGVDNLTRKLSDYGLSPNEFTHNFESLIRHDVEALDECWTSLDARTQDTFAKPWSNRPSIDVTDSPLFEPLQRELTVQPWNADFKNMAQRCLRYPEMYRRIARFWQAWGIYAKQQVSGQIATTVLESLLKLWEELFAVLVAPASRRGEQYFLNVYCPARRYKNVHTYFSNIDASAYSAFQQYVQDYMRNINCTSFRNKLNGGIRSLNCYVFNRLTALHSKNEHPQALLFGCRSGVQYQVLAKQEPSSHPIIGMVAVYFPLYDFFANCGLAEEDRSLMGESDPIRTDAEYEKIWRKGFTSEQQTNPHLVLAQLLLKPFGDPGDQDMNAIRRHLEVISSSSDKIRNHIMQNGLPDYVDDVLYRLSSKFTPDAAQPLGEWLDLVAANFRSDQYSRLVGRSETPTRVPDYPADTKSLAESITTKEESSVVTAPRMTKEILGLDKVRGKVDIGILTVRQDEFDAVLDRFPDHDTVPGKKGLWEYSTAQTNYGPANIIIATIGNKGQGTAQAIARNLIDDILPPWLFLVGIAGGLPDHEYTLGDVLLANRFIDFSMTVAVEGLKTEMNVLGEFMHVDVESLLNNLRAQKKQLGYWHSSEALKIAKPAEEIPESPPPESAQSKFYGDNEWRKKVHANLKKYFPPGQEPSPPDFWIAPAASGNVVVKDTELAAEWKQACHDIAFVEMELMGVYLAARHGGNRNCRVVAVRGLSDIIGYRRRPEWTSFACHSAASFAHTLILSGIPLLLARSATS